jgi:hypothetical protein
MYKIIVIGGPAENYIEQCLISIINQNEHNWEAQVIIDPVDNSYEIAKRYKSNKLNIHKNLERKFALPNIIEAIDRLKPNDEDILVLIDLDDWLANRKVLSTLNNYYKNNDLLVTYGSWKSYPYALNYPNNSMPYTQEDFRMGIRNAEWKGTALRTMKYKVWKNIRVKDLKDKNGNYFKTAWDVAIMMPALEMAGFDRSQFIKEIIYIYNKMTPFNDDKLYLKEQRVNKDYICSLSSYRRL